MLSHRSRLSRPITDNVALGAWLPTSMEAVSDENCDPVFAVNCKAVYLTGPYRAADESARVGQHPS